MINKIKNGSIKTIKLKTKDSAELDVRGDDSIGWYSESETGNKSSNVVSKARLQKLFNVYNTVEIIEGMSNINTSIQSVIVGCDSSYYWGVLRYLVDHINNRPISYIFIIVIRIPKTDAVSGRLGTRLYNNILNTRYYFRCQIIKILPVTIKH